MMSFQCSFFCHPSSPYDVIPVLLSRHSSSPMMSFQCSFLVIPVPISLSSQCPDTGIQLS
ncbi:hypothetical protein [Wolbachia endosymbiont of Dactylopius coccus]